MFTEQCYGKYDARKRDLVIVDCIISELYCNSLQRVRVTDHAKQRHEIYYETLFAFGKIDAKFTTVRDHSNEITIFYLSKLSNVAQNLL